MITINKDILSVTSGIIVQQVNCKGVFNAGLAKQTREKYPEVYEFYQYYVKHQVSHNIELLGDFDMTWVSENLQVVLLFAQENYGREKKRYTSYDALDLSLSKLKYSLNSKCSTSPIYFPYLMGCGLGGGKWSIVSSIIETYFPDGVICKLG